MVRDAANSAHAEYTDRLSERRAEAQRRARQERQIATARLIVFAAGGALALLVFDTAVVSSWWLLIPLVLFIGLVLAHDQVIVTRRRADRAVAFYERGLDRLNDRWMGKGEPGERFVDPTHTYAADLDLFGRGSLFELLCTARTRAGEDALAAWLCRPAVPDEIRARQMAVQELQPQLDLREQIALIGSEVRAGLDADTLAAWGAAPPLLPAKTARVAAAALVTWTLAAGVGWAMGGVGPLPLLVGLAMQAAFALHLRARVARVLHAAERPDRDLGLLAGLLARLEAERFSAPRLAQLRATLDTDGIAPSRRIARLHRLIHLLDARKNQLFAPLSGLLLWATQLAFAIEAWRAVSGGAIARWLAAVGELEALLALAGYAYEHRADPFPEVVNEGPCFDGKGLGHPLIPEQRCVRNDVQLSGGLQLLVVSGSNMSGKSTLLRTVGINAVLALAGAPVRAVRLRLSPLAVGASIRTLDSLQGGTSRFYAEITRLRQLMDLANGPLRLLFLLDEILHGTNSHDRGIGAAAVVRGFVARGAIGLVTTHDLALTRITDALGALAANVHFQDHIDDGKMIFDYRMRPGVVEKSNAIALMRAVGLEV